MDHVDLMRSTARRIWNEKKRLLEEGDETISNNIAEGKDFMGILCKHAISLPHIHTNEIE